MRKYALDVVFPRVYKKHAGQAVEKNKALFVEVKQTEMPDSFVQMWDFLTTQTACKVEYFSLEQMENSHYAYYQRCKTLAEKLAMAQYVFLSDASEVVSCVPLRKETVVCQLWHACGAFKKWGLSTADKLFGASRKQQTQHPYYGNLSVVTVSSPEVVWAYCEAMGLQETPEIVQPLGVSRTDVFFDTAFLCTAREHIYTAIPAAKGKHIVLYAPTFRGMPRNAQAPCALDIEAMAGALTGHYVLLIKDHPFVRLPQEIPESCKEFAFNVSDLPIDELLAVSDMCITDYSSVVFEYSLFERPMFFFAYDKEDYTDWRGFYYNYESFVPGPIVTTTAELISCIQQAEANFNSNSVRAFKEKFMQACDGHATQRIFAYMKGLMQETGIEKK